MPKATYFCKTFTREPTTVREKKVLQMLSFVNRVKANVIVGDHETYCNFTNTEVVILTQKGSWVSDYKTVQYYPILFDLFYDGYGYQYDDVMFHKFKNGQIIKTNNVPAHRCSFVANYGDKIILAFMTKDGVELLFYDTNFDLIDKKQFDNIRISYITDIKITKNILYIIQRSRYYKIDLNTNTVNECDLYSLTNSSYKNRIFGQALNVFNKFNLYINEKLSKINTGHIGLANYNDHIIMIHNGNFTDIYNYKDQLLYRTQLIHVNACTNRYIVYHTNDNMYINEFTYYIKQQLIKKIQNTTYKHIWRMLI